MSYIDRVLQAEEQVVYRARVHWVVYLSGAFAVCLGGIVAGVGVAYSEVPAALVVLAGGALTLLVGLWSLLKATIARLTTELAVTDRRVLVKVGLISRSTSELNRGKIQGVVVNQSILGRLLGYGTVIVTGTGGGLAPIQNVDNPLAFRNHVPLM